MASSADHEGTRALVTGGAQGLGLAVAERLVEEGCRALVIAGRDEAKGARAVERLTAMGAEASFVRVEMGEVASVRAMVDEAAARLGRLDALVNSAADTGRGSILDTEPEVWDRIMDVNARGPFFALQRFAARAIEAGHPAGCVNVLSIVLHGGTSFLAPYGASKAALLYVTKNAAARLARHRIRVNGVNVGWMDTPAEDQVQREIHGRPEGWLRDVEAAMPFGQLVKPQEVARQVCLFLSPASGVVTGTTLDFEQHVVGTFPDTDEI